MTTKPERYKLHHGDCREVLKTFPDNSIDSIVTDPPYELGFMGKSWDNTGVAYDVRVWTECLRVLKPGGHLLAFGGSRTYHRLAVAVEDAGFQIRDQIMWVYGSGFPKSLDVSKAIDKQAGVERERQVDTPITDAALQWDGWGTALKPAHEPIVLARKPLIGTVADNVLTHGTGALNIDGCRVAHISEADRASATPQGKVTVNKVGNMPDVENDGRKELERPDTSKGRWPANFIHDGSDEVLELFPDRKGGAYPAKSNIPTGRHYEGGWGAVDNGVRTEMGGSGSAARFFYSAKASKADRNDGLEGMPPISASEMVERRDGSAGMDSPRAGAGRTSGAANFHPTVKPTDLMRYLCRLVTPPDGTVLDPFTGSGSTGKAAILEGFRFIGCELTDDYLPIIVARIIHAQQNLDPPALF